MYKYVWDAETGGILLLNVQSNIVPEVRPVFYEELNLLGLDRYWSYAESEAPYMWHDGEAYYYRGRKMLSYQRVTRFTDDYTVEYLDEESVGMRLEPVNLDSMCRKNQELMDALIKEALREIYNRYRQYARQVDAVSVSYSAGKDSCVLLDLVKRVLPRGSYIVLNSDTTMEFSFTENLIKHEQEICKAEGIPFYRAKAEFDAREMWERIGLPSKPNRWCCSVQKSVPIFEAVNKITGKNHSSFLSIIGNRANESPQRRKLSSIGEGVKYSRNIVVYPILNWNSAEVFLYIFNRGLWLNEGYRRGNKRIGCKICPMATEAGLKTGIIAAPEECGPWLKLVCGAYGDESEEMLAHLAGDHGWKERNGSVGTVYASDFSDRFFEGKYYLDFKKSDADWRMWMKTIGILSDDRILFRGKEYPFAVCVDSEGTHVTVSDETAVKDADFIRLFRTVFIKAVFCEACHTCAIECPTGSMEMRGGKVRISDACIHCASCHRNHHICFAYRSKYVPEKVIE